MLIGSRVMKGRSEECAKLRERDSAMETAAKEEAYCQHKNKI